MDDKKIFDGVVFSLDPSIDFPKHNKLMENLLKHGGRLWKNDQTETADFPTHIITERALKSTSSHLVLPEWVTAALRNGFTHEPNYYYPDATKILTGVVVATINIPERDEISIFGATLALGGQHRDSLTKDVTHLVCLAPHGDEYKKAIETMTGTVKVILPHWFDYCFKLSRLVREDAFLFPDPLFLHFEDEPHPNATNTNTIVTLPCPRPGPTVYPYPLTTEQAQLIEPLKHLFKDTLIYIHSDIFIPAATSDLISRHLIQSGAKITMDYGGTMDSNSTYRLTIFVFRYRDCDLCMEIAGKGHMVVSLSWLTNTLYRGYFESPLRSLWDYPPPKCGIIGMKKMSATVTGYEAGARSLIFQLCNLVGLRWTPNLESDTTLIICSKRQGEKYKVGRSRNFNIVNHLWLEECYQHWELKSITLDRYTCFPEYDILQNMVGKTPLLKYELERWNSKETQPDVAPFIPPHLLCTVLANSDTKKFLENAESQQPDNLTPNSTDDKERAETDQEQHKVTPDTNTAGPALDKTSNLRGDISLDNHSSTETTGLTKKSDKGKRPSSSVPRSRVKRTKMDKNDTSTEHAQPLSSNSSLPDTQESASYQAHRRLPPLRKKAPTPALTRKQEEAKSLDEDMPTATEPPSGTDGLTFAKTPTAISTTSCVLTKAEEKSIKKLGSRIVPDILKADLLIVNDRVLRTPKFLCAINLGITIVNKQWLTDSIENETWCHPGEYQVHDKEMEETYGFSLQASIIRAQQSGRRQLGDGNGKTRKGVQGIWLKGYEVCTLQAASGQMLKEVVETAGGIFIQVPKRHALETKKKDHTKLLALTNKEDKKRSGWKDLQAQGFSIYDQELVIVGSLCQELRLDSFKLG